MSDDNHKLANEFDADLYRLVLRAERYAGNRGANGVRWTDVLELLQDARRDVRKMMSVADREKTR